MTHRAKVRCTCTTATATIRSGLRLHEDFRHAIDLLDGTRVRTKLTQLRSSAPARAAGPVEDRQQRQALKGAEFFTGELVDLLVPYEEQAGTKAGTHLQVS